ncbi:hypothetical protein HKE85_003059 [Escherichia coli]|uniref:hypothetical protein n=1 Tax=Escherichia coli TaxID=562 RepID=UPI000BE57411|nr:hypothetical protein [Escherichia coli]EEV8837712.1 hypothetical protein [Escherichia coli]EFA2087146.1 hypothetical protein [Escherichia coli]EFB4607535.1 hypothetical protein [Escherichia coli]EFE2447416.1 hypothetical protein [Escherichia coli]EFI7782765.1 hypothetical protein [Escherichia coli]
MTEIIYGGIGVIALICGGLWRLHRNQLATENRLSKLESSDALLNQKFETMQSNHDQIADRVSRMEQTLHEIDRKVVAMDAKFDQVIDLLKQK